MSLTLTSPAFAEGGEIPPRYTCEGEDVSPPLAWSAPPAGTRSLDHGDDSHQKFIQPVRRLDRHERRGPLTGPVSGVH